MVGRRCHRLLGEDTRPSSGCCPAVACTFPLLDTDPWIHSERARESYADRCLFTYLFTDTHGPCYQTNQCLRNCGIIGGHSTLYSQLFTLFLTFKNRPTFPEIFGSSPSQLKLICEQTKSSSGNLEYSDSFALVWYSSTIGSVSSDYVRWSVLTSFLSAREEANFASDYNLR